MTRRNSPRDIQGLDDLSFLSRIVVDKRSEQRASAKKSRRNRHYEKQFIRNAMTQKLIDVDAGEDGELLGSERELTHCNDGQQR